MAVNELSQQPLDVVTACRSADFRILQLGLEGLRRFVPFRKLYVITAPRNIPRFRRGFGEGVEILNEDEMIPGMTLQALRTLFLPGFPHGAGWYFQQLLKFAFGFRETETDYYLIWDADTVPLRPLQFFDSSGRMLFTTANEMHEPYFDNYRRLLGEGANREFSFIAQHIIVQKSILRELLQRIERNCSGPDGWAWTIMRNLQGSSTNLFSEYETLGHYVKNHYPTRAVYRHLSWLREGGLKTFGRPTSRTLNELAETYDFVAFESGHHVLRRFVRGARDWMKPHLKRPGRK